MASFRGWQAALLKALQTLKRPQKPRSSPAFGRSNGLNGLCLINRFQFLFALVLVSFPLTKGVAMLAQTI